MHFLSLINVTSLTCNYICVFFTTSQSSQSLYMIALLKAETICDTEVQYRVYFHGLSHPDI